MPTLTPIRRRMSLIALAATTVAALLTQGAAIPASATDRVATTAAARQVVAAGTYQNGSSALTVTGKWLKLSSIHDSGGSVAYATRTSSVSMTFTGTTVTWLSRRTSSSGINDVYIDGTKVASVDRYSSTPKFTQAVWKTTSLKPGTHTIRIAHTGKKNSRSSSENLIFDAFVVGSTTSTEAVGPTVGVGVYEADSTALRFSGRWSKMPSSSDSGGSSGYLNSAGWTKLAFRGDAVKWVSRTTPSSGIANVWLDGRKVATVDRFSAQTLYRQTVFERSGLSNSTHTIKIEWTGRKNARSSDENLLIDSIVVPDTTKPATPKNVRASASGGDVLIAWNPVADSNLAGYRVYRVESGEAELVGRAPKSRTSFRALGVPAHSRLTYAVTAVDAAGNESPKTALSTSTGTTAAGSYRFAKCPAATTTVTNPAQFTAAVAKAKPGSVIRMAAGVYRGQLEITATGSAQRPIWICGSRDVTIDGGGFTVNSPITVNRSSHVIVTGMTATNALKGVTVRASDHITISDMLVRSIGYEGIHLRSNTTDSVVVGNTVRKTGRLDRMYGEGIYIGSSKNNWCTYTNCAPDRSDRNSVLDNTISETGSDLIEAKEGTTDGLISGNRLDGTNGMVRTESWVQIAGNNWVVTGNSGGDSSLHGYHVNGASAGWGLGTTFSENVSDVNAAGFGFDLYELRGAGTSNTLVSCGNTVRRAASGFANVECID